MVLHLDYVVIAMVDAIAKIRAMEREVWTYRNYPSMCWESREALKAVTKEHKAIMAEYDVLNAMHKTADESDYRALVALYEDLASRWETPAAIRNLRLV